QVASIGDQSAAELLATPYVGVTDYSLQFLPGGRHIATPLDRHQSVVAPPITNLDSVFNSPSPAFAKSYVSQALNDARRQRQEFEYRTLVLTDQARLMRRHDIELQRKFTLSIAVLVFFFIGAPLGAIIKKGGLGTPLVISVFLFIVYYIIDNAGYKMARDGKVAVWIGIWLSTAALLPLGIFFTRKAIDDSAVFNIDTYRNFFLRLIGKRPERSLEVKEVIMAEVEVARAVELLQELRSAIAVAQAAYRRRLRPLHLLPCKQMQPVAPALSAVVDYLCNSSDPVVINLLNKYPFEPLRRDLDAMLANTDAILNRINP
ncbi:MAG: LptF/LptG family permease, partial [Muribaculaceae bacterium]